MSIRDSEWTYLADAIRAARQVQEYLWGEYNEQWGIEEWRRMFRKRVAKIEDIDPTNPHWDIEFKKRLLQTAALSIAFMALLDEKVQGEAITNLPQYADKLEAPHDRP